MRLTLTLGLRLIALAMFASTAASAQTKVQPGSAGNQITFTAAGDLTLDGACFGGVTSPPAGAVSVFGGKATAKNGNLYFQGPITWYSGLFPDGAVVRSGGVNLASMTNAGALYLKGQCYNVAGCRNTTWEPSRWNDGGTVQWNNNCYNYANDKITGTFAQPGRASGNQSPYPPTVPEVRDGALTDGLTWVGWTFPGNTYDCGNGHLVFMAVAPGYDYHWFRLDQTKGVWSHKPGSTPAKNVDNSNSTITNPLVANRGVYTENGGFYCTCGGLANIN